MSSREQARVAPLDEVVRVFGVFARVSWPVVDAAVGSLVEQLGWKIVSDPSDEFVRADTGWALSRPTADLSSDSGELTSVSFRITDVVLDEVDWRADFSTMPLCRPNGVRCPRSEYLRRWIKGRARMRTGTWIILAV